MLRKQVFQMYGGPEVQMTQRSQQQSKNLNKKLKKKHHYISEMSFKNIKHKENNLANSKYDVIVQIFSDRIFL